MARAPHLHAAVRAFCLAAFARLAPEAGGGELPFVLDEHGSGLYEYRPLIRDHVESRAFWLGKLPDAEIALAELRREPAAAVFARARGEPSEERELFRAILLPLLTRTAEACGGFDWEDRAFEHVYADLERSLYGSSRSCLAVAPLVGLSVAEPVALARGISVRSSSPADLALRWPEAPGLLPPRFGEEAARSSVVELERELSAEIVEFPQTDSRMVPGTELLYEVVMDRDLEHDGDPILRRHMENAAAQETGRGWRLAKRKAKLPMDAAISTLMVVARMLDPIQAVRPRFTRL